MTTAKMLHLRRTSAIAAMAGLLIAGGAAAQKPGRILRLSTTAELDANFVSCRPPEYTAWMRSSFVSGTGIFRITIDPSGNVANVQVVQTTGIRELDTHTVNALKHWRAKPGPKRLFDIPINYQAPTEFKPANVLKPAENRNGTKNDGRPLGGP